MIAVGEWEKNHRSRIVENAFELWERLLPLEPRGLQTIYKEFPEESHVSILPLLISRTLRFALTG